MAFIIKARILLHIARKNPLPVLGGAAQVLIMLLGGALFGGGAVAGIVKGDVSNLLFIVIGLAVGALCLLGATVVLPFEFRMRLRRLLRVTGTQEQGFVYSYEYFQSQLPESYTPALF